MTSHRRSQLTCEGNGFVKNRNFLAQYILAKNTDTCLETSGVRSQTKVSRILFFIKWGGYSNLRITPLFCCKIKLFPGFCPKSRNFHTTKRSTISIIHILPKYRVVLQKSLIFLCGAVCNNNGPVTTYPRCRV